MHISASMLAPWIVTFAVSAADPGETARARGVVLFVPDGLRAQAVNDEIAPTFAELRRKGVDFRDSHSLFPTLTMPNASAMATGHYLGDTGIFGNALYAGYAVPVPPSSHSMTPFIESDPVLAAIEKQLGSDFVHEESIVHAARARGIRAAVIGKLGPAAMFDVTDENGVERIIIDDSTGLNDAKQLPLGIPIPKELQKKMTERKVSLQAVLRGANGNFGSSSEVGTKCSNRLQQEWFMQVTMEAILPWLVERRNGNEESRFLLIYWSRDPDGTQHNEGDSLNKLEPGIDGAASHDAIRNADGNLKRILERLDDLEPGLSSSTDVIVTADHGFSTISKQSDSSSAAHLSYSDVPPKSLPPGFLAIDLGIALGLDVFDPDDDDKLVKLVLDPGAADPSRATDASLQSAHPSKCNALLGKDSAAPEVIVAANGGSDLIYLPRKDPAHDQEIAGRIVDALLRQDYVSGLFIDPSLGTYPSALSLDDIGLTGSAMMPRPSIVVSFRSFSRPGAADPLLSAVDIADTTLQQGQGIHGSFSRADTNNFMAAKGPSFTPGPDDLPVSNADIGATIADILDLALQHNGALRGRVLTEAMSAHRGEPKPKSSRDTLPKDAANEMLRTLLERQTVNGTRYFDVAGFRGRTLGLDSK